MMYVNTLLLRKQVTGRPERQVAFLNWEFLAIVPTECAWLSTVRIVKVKYGRAGNVNVQGMWEVLWTL